MTLASDIITAMYRESNLIGIGVQPNDNEVMEGIAILNRVVSGVLGFDIGEKLSDWPVGTVGYAQQNQLAGWNVDSWQWPPANARLLVNANTAQTINLPSDASDGARMALIDVQGNLSLYPITLDGNGRTIEGEPALILNDDGFNGVWLYRADLGDWRRLATLLATDEMPFPAEFDDAFITRGAMRVNPRYGRALTAETTAEMQNSFTRLRARYRQRTVTGCDLAVLALSRQAYAPGSGLPLRGGGPSGWMA